MKLANFRIALRSLLRKRPFESFIVELASGGRLEVEHPEAFTVHRGTLIVYRSKSGIYSLTEIEQIVRFIEAKDLP